MPCTDFNNVNIKFIYNYWSKTRQLKRIITLFVCLIAISVNSYGQSREQVYSGVILHIMNYVEWPSYNSEMTIGIVNDPDLVRTISKASAGKKVHFKDVSIQKLESEELAKEVDVLFFSKRVIKGFSPQEMKSAKGILIITEESGEVASTASINFIQRNGSLRLELYNQTAELCGFRISDQLKKLAILKWERSQAFYW